mmetsp:Transcript_77694/g.137624  ORF Transcript_77694/g.137624 Transcript_77694/m.137624 type:complete len:1519 (+) Transcript_77694:118-4674(+)
MRRGKTIEEIYQKKSQLEHILLRPDTYVGSTEHMAQEMWVYNEKQKEIEWRRINFVPALYKIFDEILVNAADNLMRDKSMNLIDVTIDKKACSISVMNNGRGVPIQIHKEHQCYVPELIFGHLLTSDNYDDNEKKVTGGRNGYGAKLTNVFSTQFRIETSDSKGKKKYSQLFENNMTQKHPPEIVDYEGEDYTRVTFSPDLKRFGMKRLDDDIASLMMKRVYDVAGSSDPRCRVVLNGKTLPISCFQDYVNLYLNTGSESSLPLIHEQVNKRWEIAISVADGTFQQVSFVNSINTVKGGSHVAHVTDQLVDVIQKTVKSKNRGGIDIKPAMVRNHLWVFVNCLIENPAFDSQTKETLTTKQAKFGSTCELSDKTVKQVLKSGVVEMILDWVKAKEKVDMSRSLRAGNANAKRVFGIAKLEDANLAGGKQSNECTLILTEGDSAKALAVAGLGVVGRDRYGVFPLKGKVLNVREANFKQVTGNTEIQNLLKILGMDIKREYDSVNDLRYGSVTIMTDQDHDGSHIKGLLINMVHHWWPSLLGMGFLKEFVTPIVKVWKEGKKSGERLLERSFFTVVEYEAWKEKSNNAKGWKAKYYKGLGTSTANEAKEYFRDIDKHEIGFKWEGEHDGEAIDLAFNKKRADDRKDWINSYQEGTCVDHSQKELGYSDFVHKELVQFAKYDVMRAIPSVVDGLKPGQRKVIFSAFKKKLKSDIKVAQFVGYISEHSAYHHGEMSLENTIVNLAQDFVGSNNINLLVPSGQFGTRLQGGSDHAAARYIYTRLSAVTRLIFHPDDDHVLKYLDEEGQRIEPEWYCPILPMALVNGSKGIGTGWSTDVPNFNPRDIIMNMRRMLRGLKMQEMLPWYRGFRGSIAPAEDEKDKFDVLGSIVKKDAQTLEITELPVKVWTSNYKDFLEGQLSEHNLDDLREYHTERTVHFEMKLAKDKMQKAERQGLEKTFKLERTMSTTNMMLFNAEGKITKYGSALEILEEFCTLRRQVYVRRKAYLVGKLTKEKEILSNKARFILMVVKGELELRKRKKVELLEDLRRHGFKAMSELEKLVQSSLEQQSAEQAAAAAASGDADDSATSGGSERSDYDYLLGMPLWSLTFEKIEEIKKQLEIKRAELKVLQDTTEEMMWDKDLEALSKALDELDLKDAEEEAKASKLSSGQGRGRGRSRGKVRDNDSPPPTMKQIPAGVLGKSALGSEKDLARPIVNCEAALTANLKALRKAQSSRILEPSGEQQCNATADAAGASSAGSAAAVAAPAVAVPAAAAGPAAAAPAAAAGPAGAAPAVVIPDRVDDMKKRLKELGKPYYGSKVELIKRLTEAEAEASARATANQAAVTVADVAAAPRPAHPPDNLGPVGIDASPLHSRPPEAGGSSSSSAKKVQSADADVTMVDAGVVELESDAEARGQSESDPTSGQPRRRSIRVVGSGSRSATDPPASGASSSTSTSASASSDSVLIADDAAGAGAAPASGSADAVLIAEDAAPGGASATSLDPSPPKKRRKRVVSSESTSD